MPNWKKGSQVKRGAAYCILGNYFFFLKRSEVKQAEAEKKIPLLHKKLPLSLVVLGERMHMVQNPREGDEDGLFTFNLTHHYDRLEKEGHTGT